MSTEEKLVADLHMMAEQLARMANNASFVQDGHVRVSDPNFLSVSLSQAASAISRLSAEVQELREALRPFVKVFEARRDFYSRRHSDRDLGYANFDKMPDGWPMEKVILTMGEFRRARAALKPEPVND